MLNKHKIYLIDWYNFIYRLFYAIPPFTLKDWTPINATFWLAKMVISWYKEDRPDFLVFILDHKWRTFREDIYEDYKWTRDKMPTDLKTQEDLMFEVLRAFDVPMISVPWYEADDIIWTLAMRLRKNKDNDIYILSWDKDLFQFVDENVAIYDTMKRKVYHRAEAIEKFWVEPEHIVDYLSICWDSSDNIPWIKWFWPKKAQELINKYWNLEKIYENIDDIAWKTKEVLEASHEVAFLSKKLASIHAELELPGFSIENHIFKTKNIFTDEAIELLKRFEFKSLIPTAHQDKIKNFETLWVTPIRVSDMKSLNDLEKKIFEHWRVAITANWNWAFDLESLNLFVWEKEIYYADTSEIELTGFLKRLLEDDIELIGFDIKEDLKKIYGYLSWRWQKMPWSKSEFQASLF